MTAKLLIGIPIAGIIVAIRVQAYVDNGRNTGLTAPSEKLNGLPWTDFSATQN